MSADRDGESRRGGVRGHDVILDMLSGKTDFERLVIFEEAYNFSGDKTFELLQQYFKTRLFTDRANRLNLQMAQMEGMRARNMYLPYVMAKGINLNFADLAGSDFNHADFRRAGFRRAHLAKAVLHHAYFTGTILIEADLSEADLTEAVFNDASLTRANLSRAKLVKAKLRNAQMDFVNLEGADLTEADLSRSSLRSVNLRGAILNGAIFTNTTVKDVLVDDNTRMTGAKDLRLDVRLARPED